MSKKSTPEQKAYWNEHIKGHRARSRMAVVIPSPYYNPPPKAPSRRDKIRAGLIKRDSQFA